VAPSSIIVAPFLSVETLSKVAFLEAEVAKWKVTACTVWIVKRPKVANATIAFAEVVRSNRQLSSKVFSVLAKLLCLRLDGDQLFARCKSLQEEKKDLAKKVEGIAAERNELAKVVANLEAWLKESESKLEDSELWAAREREANKEVEEELLVYKKKAMKQHERGFKKTVRQAGLFAKDLALGLFDPFKDMKDGVFLDKEEIATKEEAVDEE